MGNYTFAPTPAPTTPETLTFDDVGKALDEFETRACDILNGSSGLCPNGNLSGLALVMYDNITFSFSACDGVGGTIFSNITKTETGNRGSAASLVAAIYKGTRIADFVPEFMRQLSKFMYGVDDFRRYA